MIHNSSSELISFIRTYKHCMNASFPVAIYRYPNMSDVHLIHQMSTEMDAVNNWHKQKGFVFSPFDKHTHAQIFIRGDVATSVKIDALIGYKKEKEMENIMLKSFDGYGYMDKQMYTEWVKQIKEQIREGKLEKAIAARIDWIPHVHIGAMESFLSLCHHYPDAFISLVYTRETGLWIGATPELLLQIEQEEIKTVSLAGTKVAKPIDDMTQVIWGGKEKEEQALVTRYIYNVLSHIGNPTCSNATTVLSGHLYHLQSILTVPFDPKISISKLIDKLHPSPAVGGMPKDEAYAYIADYEQLDRKYYAGYLGPINMDCPLRLFVNLRCMEQFSNGIAMYIGCGITIDSNPSKEWNESYQKSLVVKRIFGTHI